MPTMKSFSVSLNKAEKNGEFVSIHLALTKEVPRLTFEAATVTDVVSTVKRFALEHGQPCAAFVRCLSPRKPAGFDAATRHLYFNLGAPKADNAKDLDANSKGPANQNNPGWATE